MKNIRGRPKGSKSKLGIPSKGLIEAIDLVKRAYEKAENSIMSVTDITEFMGLKKGSNFPVLGTLVEYGLIEKEGIGYKISDLGKKAIKKDKFSIKEAFEKNIIFRNLITHFGDKDVTKGLIIDYLKKKYRKGENVNLIAQRFVEGINYIKSINGRQEIEENQKISQPESISKIIKLIKLKYALKPPKEKEIPNLIENLCEELKKDKNKAIKTLAINLEKNKENEQILKVLFESLLTIIESEYPDLNLQDNKRIAKQTKEDGNSTKTENNQ